jgi:hypothetical protein
MKMILLMLSEKRGKTYAWNASTLFVPMVQSEYTAINGEDPLWPLPMVSWAFVSRPLSKRHVKAVKAVNITYTGVDEKGAHAVTLQKVLRVGLPVITS